MFLLQGTLVFPPLYIFAEPIKPTQKYINRKYNFITLCRSFFTTTREWYIIRDVFAYYFVTTCILFTNLKFFLQQLGCYNINPFLNFHAAASFCTYHLHLKKRLNEKLCSFSFRIIFAHV